MMESGRFYNCVFNELGLLVMHGVCFESRQTYELEAQGNYIEITYKMGLVVKDQRAVHLLFFSLFFPFSIAYYFDFIKT